MNRIPEAAAVVLAAGKGTRMKSDLAKVLFPLAGRPLVDHVLDAVDEAGFGRTVIVVGHQADRVEAAVSDRGRCVLQSPQLGTGHAVQCAVPALEGFEGTVAVLAGDVPLIRGVTLRRMLEHHGETGATVTVLTARVPDPTGYGRMVRDAGGRITAIVEEKDASDAIRAVDEINSGIYAFQAGFLRRTLPMLQNRNRQGEYYLTDTIGIAFAEGVRVEGILVDDPREVAGINTPEQLAATEAVWKEWHRGT